MFFHKVIDYSGNAPKGQIAAQKGRYRHLVGRVEDNGQAAPRSGALRQPQAGKPVRVRGSKRVESGQRVRSRERCRRGNRWG